MINKNYLLVFALGLVACKQPKASLANTNHLYFDVKGYFSNEVSRLQHKKTAVKKTVIINGISETKTINITNWEKELAIFINADINKASWQGSFKTSKENGFSIYTSDDKKIPVKKIRVKKEGLNVTEIEIIVNNKNILFQSTDTLTYYPDSLYRIAKQQKIRFLEDKKYSIIGSLK